MQCSNDHRMFNYDDLNFECKRCGETLYRATDVDRIRLLTNAPYNRPTCPVCGRVSVPNNGGFSCIHCSHYYELEKGDRPQRIMLMPSTKDCLPNFAIVTLVLLAANYVIAWANLLGGWVV